MWRSIFLVFIFADSAHAQNLNQVELQWSVCEGSERELFRKLEVHPEKRVQRDVYYTDTDHLDLIAKGAYIRTRVTKSKIKTSAKIKNYSESQIPWDFLQDQDYKCEIDSYTHYENIGCSLYYEPKNKERLLSDLQEQFIVQGVQFNDFYKLQRYGPVQSHEWAWHENAVGEDITLERLDGPKHFFSMELSVRVPLSKKQQAHTRIQHWLSAQSIQLCPQQKGRTEELLKLLAL